MGERIAVLGAGPMGLAVAYQLLRDGHSPTIFEADDRIGGMTASFDFSGTAIERYYHFHCTSDSAFLTLISELGIADKMIWTETKMGYWYDNKLQPWGNPSALLSFRGLSILSKIRYGLMMFISTKRKNWRSLDKLNAISWIKRWVGQEAYEILWRRLFAYKFYSFSGNLSAAWIWSRIRRLGTSRYSIFKEKLGYLQGGSSTLLTALRVFMEENGVEIKLSHPVERVLIENGRVVGIETSKGVEIFSKVISTIPLPLIHHLIPSLPKEILEKYRSVNNIAVVCVIVKLKKRLSDYFWINISDDEMDIPGLVEFTNLRPLNAKASIIYVPFYLPTDNKKYKESDIVFIKKVKQYLMKINPNLTQDDFIDVHANRYKYAQPVCEPGFLSKLPPVALPIEGLWVADTSYYYPEDRGISESIDFGRYIAKMISKC